MPRPALKAAGVGISVDSAKKPADILLPPFPPMLNKLLCDFP
ncbi:hypothetical protein [Janthinobacterium sp.]|nr:hypothetical protein [Janthinobacterium sp.]